MTALAYPYTINSNDSFSVYHCPICPRVFKYEGSMWNHADKVHRVSPETHWLVLIIKRLMWREK